MQIPRCASSNRWRLPTPDPAGGGIAISSLGPLRLLRCELDPWHHRLSGTLTPKKAGVLRHSPGIGYSPVPLWRGRPRYRSDLLSDRGIFRRNRGPIAELPTVLCPIRVAAGMRLDGHDPVMIAAYPRHRWPAGSGRPSLGRLTMPLLHVMRDFGRWLRWITLIIAATAVLQAAANALPIF